MVLKIPTLNFLNNSDEETKIKLGRIMTANEFVNVRDIKDDIIYTKDNQLFMYLKIPPISLELLSPKEQKIKGKQFTAEFSAIKRTYKIFAISRPVDVSFILENLKHIQLEVTENKQRKEILKEKIREVNNYAFSGEILEHQFFLILWLENKKNAEREILKQANEVMARFTACEMSVSICQRGDIVKLLNLFANPNYAHLENDDVSEYIPFVV